MAQTRPRVVIRDRGALALLAKLREPVLQAQVGVQGAEAAAPAQRTNRSVGEIAGIHEYGVGVPRRAWLSSWCDANEARILEAMRVGGLKMLSLTGTARGALETIGREAMEGIKAGIEAGIGAPVDGRTPLIETGQLLKSITAVVTKAPGGRR
jgi:hypothetical protein